MIGTRLSSGTDESVHFDPLDYKIGAFLSGLGIIIGAILITRRKQADAYIRKILVPVNTRKTKHKR